MNAAPLTRGPVGKTLIRLTGPMILGLVSIVLFNLVDTFFIGRLGAVPLAAMGFTYPVVMVVNSIALGLGIGASAVISRAVGRGDVHEVRRMTTDSLALSVLIVAIFVAAGELTMKPLFTQLGAEGPVLDQVIRYMRIWFFGVLFVVVPMVGNNAIRAAGDTLTPGLIMLASALVNLILDPLLIFGVGPFPRLEIEGAAIATVIARATSLTVALMVLVRREKMVTLKRPALHDVWQSWKRILHLGLPTAFTRLAVPLGMGLVTRLAAGFGAAAVAGLGVGLRVEFFGMAVIMALASVLNPFIGQNIGAGRLDRVREAVRWASRFSLIWGALMAVVFGVLAGPVARLFNSETAVVVRIVQYLRWVPLSWGAYGWLVLGSSALTVFRRPLLSSLLVVIHIFVFLSPLAWGLSRLWQLNGIFIALALAYLLAGLVAILVLNRIITQISANAK